MADCSLLSGNGTKLKDYTMSEVSILLLVDSLMHLQCSIRIGTRSQAVSASGILIVLPHCKDSSELGA